MQELDHNDPSSLQGKFVLKIIVGWADGNIVCPRGLATAWAENHAHPTFVDSKHNYLKNELALVIFAGPVTIVISRGRMQPNKLLADVWRTFPSCRVAVLLHKEKRMKKITTTIVLATALLSVTATQAGEFDGMYIGGKAGLNRSDIVGATTASRENVETFGFEEGYNWEMGGYLVGGSFFADFNQKTNRTAVAVYSGSATAGLDLKLGLPNGNLMPYAKLGWDRTTGRGAFPASQFKYTNDLHLGLGVEYKFAPNWSVAGEWTNSASKINGSKLRNDNFTVGLNYYLGGSPAVVAAPVAAAAMPVVVKEEPKAAPEPAPEPVPETWKTLLESKPVCIEGANFEFDSAKLRGGEIKKLDEVVSFAEKYKGAQLESGGHTCSIGTEAYNQKLSKRRAESVKAYLVKKGVAADRITAVGYGESKPMADNKTREGRELNRRVEVCTVVKVEKRVRVTE